MPSFDITCELNFVEVKNVVDQTSKEVGTRFDFKGSDTRVELNEKDKTITLSADDDFKLKQVTDIVLGKCAKRGVDTRVLDFQDVETIGGSRKKQIIKLKEGISQELGKKIVAQIKQSKIKVQASIQADEVRVSGGKRDDLQAAIALVKAEITELPLNFGNFRE